MDVSYQLIENEADFGGVVKHLSQFKQLALDLEGEWNLHRYGLHLCLIQVNDGENTFLIDPTRVGDVQPLLDLFEDESIYLITHGPQSDIVLLNYLYGCTPKHIFDTEKAAQLLNYEGTSLSQLLDKHFGFTKDMKVRVSDWNQRPLTTQMLAYAAKDVAYLHQLHDILRGELAERGRLTWQLEECKALEDIRYKEKEDPHLDLPGASKLNERETYVLKQIYEFRDRIAQEIDKPAYYIIPNSKLVELASDPPKNAHQWINLKGVNPRLKRYANEISEAVREALTGEIPVDRAAANRSYQGLSKSAFFRLVDQRTQLLTTLRDQIKEEYDVSHMILSMRNLKKVAYGESSLEDFRAWQQEIVVKTAAALDLDISILRSAAVTN